MKKRIAVFHSFLFVITAFLSFEEGRVTVW